MEVEEQNQHNPLPERVGFIVWLSDSRQARGLERYALVHYVSHKMRYAVVYVNADRAEQAVEAIQKLTYVKRVERSYRSELRTEYTKTKEDKSKFFDVIL